MKKNRSPAKAIVNRRARYDYELGETISAGIILSGPEVRGIRQGHVRLTGAYATLKDSELWLTNMSVSIPQTALAAVEAKELSQSRKLLVKKKELRQLSDAKKAGMTIVPTRLFNRGRYIKIELAIAKGKKKHDKRQTLKERDAKREASRASKLR
jgi:SsrA-binding protein